MRRVEMWAKVRHRHGMMKRGHSFEGQADFTSSRKMKHATLFPTVLFWLLTGWRIYRISVMTEHLLTRDVEVSRLAQRLLQTFQKSPLSTTTISSFVSFTHHACKRMDVLSAGRTRVLRY